MSGIAILSFIQYTQTYDTSNEFLGYIQYTNSLMLSRHSFHHQTINCFNTIFIQLSLNRCQNFRFVFYFTMLTVMTTLTWETDNMNKIAWAWRILSSQKTTSMKTILGFLLISLVRDYLLNVTYCKVCDSCHCYQEFLFYIQFFLTNCNSVVLAKVAIKVFVK